ncbi:MAG: hypothetical protein H7321_01215 [Bacteroidia bacterium]|nr:hypothetical protein [Bacteroidia bacterium]
MLNYKRYLTIAAFITGLLIIQSSSCKKKTPPTVCSEEITIKFPKNALDRLFFLDSSYWVYQDSISGQIDSFWVDYSQIGNVNLEKRNYQTKGKCYQQGRCFIKSRLQNDYTIEFTANPQSTGISLENELFNVTLIYKQNTIYYFDIGNQNYINGYTDGFVENIPEVKLKNKIFYDILKRTTLLIPSSFDIFKVSYFGNNIGLIKYIKPDGSVWELVRYKIKQ